MHSVLNWARADRSVVSSRPSGTRPEQKGEATSCVLVSVPSFRPMTGYIKGDGQCELQFPMQPIFVADRNDARVLGQTLNRVYDIAKKLLGSGYFEPISAKEFD
jgi:hypothetical protein